MKKWLTTGQTPLFTTVPNVTTVPIDWFRVGRVFLAKTLCTPPNKKVLDMTWLVGYNRPRRSVRIILACADQGQLPKWSNGTDCKSVARASEVRILHCPPFFSVFDWPMWRSGSAQSW